MLEHVIAKYNEAIFDTDRDRALQIIRDAEMRGATPEDIVFGVVLPAMDRMVQSLSERGEVNLAQHFMAAQIADAITNEMIPKFKKAPGLSGRVVIGTAYGDMHSLGKRIVIGCLRARMFDVMDLGLNVPAERFVENAVAHNAEIIAISAMMLHTARGENGCCKVREILRERKLEDQLKIIAGGAPFRFDHHLYQVIGADAWGPDALSAHRICEALIKEVRT
jgi:methanogenic corrinoid protein MtbC1